MKDQCLYSFGRFLIIIGTLIFMSYSGFSVTTVVVIILYTVIDLLRKIMSEKFLKSMHDNDLYPVMIIGYVISFLFASICILNSDFSLENICTGECILCALYDSMECIRAYISYFNEPVDKKGGI